ncbi:MAG: hypothetical protein ACM3MF_02725 [Anaerolineae bacterium]
MPRKLLFLVLALVLAACNLTAPITPPPAVPPGTPFPTGTFPAVTGPNPTSKVAAFYYPWYATPQIDGRWRHWPQNGHTPPRDLGSDFYPLLGAYSSSDAAIVAQHMEWLRQAGVGVAIVSWWGQGSPEDAVIPRILEIAPRYGIQVAFHIEPYDARTANSLVEDIKYLYSRYGSSPAFYRSTASTTYSPTAAPKGLFFVWCTASASGCGRDTVSPGYWQPAMDAVHALPEGALVIANDTDGSWVTGGHFDGLYNYATLHLEQDGGFAWARSVPAGALYIPSVIPGFSAQRVAYAADTTVPRNDGQTYNDQWTAALNTGVEPAMVTITSFNEWHEGTMIEPAAPGMDDGHGNRYADFGKLPPDGYLSLTRQWVEKFQAAAQAPAYRARIQIKTTSDWTTVSLAGGQWLQPAPVSASAAAVKAGFERGDNFLLSQSLEDAQRGQEVEMTWDVQLAGLTSGSALQLQIDRGNIGRTEVAVYNFNGEIPALLHVFRWAEVTSGRNSGIFTLTADECMTP